MSTVKRTNHRLRAVLGELEAFYGVDRNNLPDYMEVLEDGYHAVIYISDEEFKERQGDLFPRDPHTGIFCNWDPDYEALNELM